jgi:uncharacterized protein (TIGR00255 family)
MTYSMTAFARIQQPTDFGTLVWEIRSVNSRYLEIHTRLPDSFRSLDIALRSALKKKLARGKVEVQLKFEKANASAAELNFDKELVAALTQACGEIDSISGNQARLNPMQILQWPGVMTEVAMDQEALDKMALTAFDQAIDQLKENRQREGLELNKTIEVRLEAITEIAEKLRVQMPEWVQQHFANTKQKAMDLVEKFDDERLEQEIAILAQKVDVAEELDRLDVHVKETKDVLEKGMKKAEPVGRRLDFMMQEFNREANTLSSKAVNQEITRNAVELKVLIEQMREQVQNIE